MSSDDLAALLLKRRLPDVIASRRRRAATDVRPLGRAALMLRVLALGAIVPVAALIAAHPLPAAALAAPAAAPEVAATGPSKTLGDLLSDELVPGGSIVIGGLGSSVGVGATLTDPAEDAPVAYFASALRRTVANAGLARWDVVNGSVNGSTIHDGVARDWPALRRHHPDIVVLAYGMNDGAPAQFDTGETYDGAMRDLGTLISEIRASGAVPVLLTSPAPFSARYDIGSAVPPPGSVPQHPTVNVSQPFLRIRLADGSVVEESSRHAAVNAGMRAVARAEGIDMVDVEPFWLRAVAARGDDALFDPGQFVHPDLLGHRLSYHAAIDAWTASFPKPPYGGTGPHQGP